MSKGMLGLVAAGAAVTLVLLVGLVVAALVMAGRDRQVARQHQHQQQQPVKKDVEKVVETGGKQQQPAPLEVDLPPGYDVAYLWTVYASDAVVWRERFAGRTATVLLTPPHAIHDDEAGKFYTLEGYQNGTRREGVRVYLKSTDAERLSRIIREEEKIPPRKQLHARVLIGPDGFRFSDGQIVLIDRP